LIARWSRPLSALAVAAFVGACSLVVAPGDQPRCRPGADCGPGRVCSDHVDGVLRCVPVCTSSEGCERDYPARPLCAPDGRCAQCVESSQCDVGYHCTAYACQLGCNGDSSRCRPGEQCVDNQCMESTTCGKPEDCLNPDFPICLDGTCVACVGSTDCPDLGTYCRDTFCVPGCDSPERCPEGQSCVENVCVEPRPEVCNGLDDDLDTETDEDFDRDGDRYSSCIYVDDPPDCDDNAAQAFPGAAEVCDQYDNDCDGQFNEPPTCPTDYACNAVEGECVRATCASDSDCDDPGTQFCHTDGVCYPRVVAFGATCVRDSQCASPYFCIETNAVGYPGRNCTVPCCNRDDCREAGSFCADNGSGLKVCSPGSAATPSTAASGPVARRASRGSSSTSACRNAAATTTAARDASCSTR